MSILPRWTKAWPLGIICLHTLLVVARQYSPLTAHFWRVLGGGMRYEDTLDNQYLGQILWGLKLTWRGRIVRINRLEDEYFIRRLIRKPVPFLILVVLYHAILSNVIWIDNICSHQVRLINTGCITNSERPVCDRSSKSFPGTVRRLLSFYQSYICEQNLTW